VIMFCGYSYVCVCVRVYVCVWWCVRASGFSPKSPWLTPARGSERNMLIACGLPLDRATTLSLPRTPLSMAIQLAIQSAIMTLSQTRGWEVIRSLPTVTLRSATTSPGAFYIEYTLVLPADNEYCVCRLAGMMGFGQTLTTRAIFHSWRSDRLTQHRQTSKQVS
jgi:hypothetical protein